MARQKRSEFYQSVENKLSQVMQVAWQIEHGQSVYPSQLEYAFKGLELAKYEIEKKLSEVSNV